VPENINWHGVVGAFLFRPYAGQELLIWNSYGLHFTSSRKAIRPFLPRTNMRTLFKRSEQRSAFSALMTVFAVLVIGAIAKSEGAAHVAQMIDSAAQSGEIIR